MKQPSYIKHLELLVNARRTCGNEMTPISMFWEIKKLMGLKLYHDGH